MKTKVIHRQIRYSWCNSCYSCKTILVNACFSGRRSVLHSRFGLQFARICISTEWMAACPFAVHRAGLIDKNNNVHLCASRMASQRMICRLLFTNNNAHTHTHARRDCTMCVQVHSICSKSKLYMFAWAPMENGNTQIHNRDACSFGQFYSP